MSESTLFELFIEETKEHLEKINEALLYLEKEPENIDLINALFRSVHTIKGSTAAMNYVATAELIHKTEDLIHLLREGKLKVEQKVIALFFVIHDYLDNFLTIVMNQGSESELNSEHILQEVRGLLAPNGLKNNDKVQNTKSKTNKPKEVMPKQAASQVFSYNEQELESILRSLEFNEEIFLISIKLSADCIFKSIRVWMIFEELDKAGTVINSYPQKPSIDDFKNGLFTFEEEELLFVISSPWVKEAIENVLAKMSEIDDYQVAQIVMQEGAIIDKQHVSYDADTKVYEMIFEQSTRASVNDIIGSDMEQIKTSFSPQFLKEIKENVHKAQESLEVILWDASEDADKDADFAKLYRYFHTVKGLGSYIEHTQILEIAAKTEKIIDNLRKNPEEADEHIIEVIRDSIFYIETMCENPLGFEEKPLVTEIARHLERLQEAQMQEDHEVRKEQEEQKGDKRVENQEATNSPAKQEMLINKQAQAIKTEQALIRVSESKIDYLVDMLGELTIFQSQHKQEILRLLGDSEITENKALHSITKMERITKDLQNLSMSLRMVSLKQTLQKLSRIGRDSALNLGKTIDIQIIGEDTEIDRSVVEKIQDPLMHLVRNSISHGIEEDEERRKKGKTLPGQVTIEAYNRRGNVYIAVKDDGQGLSLDTIYQKALQNGQITEDKTYSEEEIIRFIFLPGLSTQEELNAISGRGVGMNVVETEIKKIGGKIEILNNPGQGCTFILKIPINLATINGAIVEIDTQRFIIPTVNIKHIFKPTAEEWVKIKGKTEFVKSRDQLIPVIQSEKLTNSLQHDYETQKQVVIILEMDQELRALPVSSILDKQEIVQKPLGKEFANAKVFSGGTILGDGKVCLILDIEALFKASY